MLLTFERMTMGELAPFSARMAELKAKSLGKVPRIEPGRVGWRWVGGAVGRLLSCRGVIGMYDKFTHAIYVPIASPESKLLFTDDNIYDASFVHEMSHAADREEKGIMWCMACRFKSEENALRDECKARHYTRTWATMTAED